MPIKIVAKKAGPKGYTRKPSKKPVKKVKKGDALSLKRRSRMTNPTIRGAGFGDINLRDKLRLLEAMEAAGMDMHGLKKGGYLKGLKGGGRSGQIGKPKPSSVKPPKDFQTAFMEEVDRRTKKKTFKRGRGKSASPWDDLGVWIEEAENMPSAMRKRMNSYPSNKKKGGAVKKRGGGKVKTTTARGMGAATRGGQFRKNG